VVVDTPQRFATAYIVVRSPIANIPQVGITPYVYRFTISAIGITVNQLLSSNYLIVLPIPDRVKPFTYSLDGIDHLSPSLTTKQSNTGRWEQP
jgi:hypothetical protein